MLDVLSQNLRKAWYTRYPTAVLCHRFKLMYFPVPKVATSSIRRLIAQMEGRPADGDPHHDIVLDSLWAKDFCTHGDYLAFAVVRNPWDRLVSCFMDKVAGRPADGTRGRTDVHSGFARYNRIFGRRLFDAEMSFDAFVDVVSRIPDMLADEHFRAQYRLLSTPNGTPLATRIITFERLHADMSALLRDVGATEFDIGHMNRTARADYREFYSEKTRKRVAHRYRRDIALFGYRF